MSAGPARELARDLPATRAALIEAASSRLQADADDRALIAEARTLADRAIVATARAEARPRGLGDLLDEEAAWHWPR